jgi:hypothetical protein
LGHPVYAGNLVEKHQWIFYNKALFTWDWNKVKPGSFHFSQSIIYNRCLHETGTKITRTGLKSFRLLDRANWLQTGMNSDRHEFRPAWIQTGMNVNTNTFQTGLGCNLDIGTTHAIKTKAIWKRKFPVKGNKLKILWFSYRSHVNMLTISIFIPVWLHPGLM